MVKLIGIFLENPAMQEARQAFLLFNTVLTSLRAPQMKAFDEAGHRCDATIHAPLVLVMAEGGRVPQQARLGAAS